ncbi:MAG: cytochrome c oxidase subunit 3 [Terriglobales bacterium]|jgi:cytochrome c oxidase subunit 3
MATLNPAITIDGGDSGGGEPQGSLDFRGRLRRARLGLAVALTPIVMLFVSFTSAYIVRQGLPSLDESTGTYARDWTALNLPLAILLINTVLLALSSLTMEFARRQMARRAVLDPVRSIPGVSVGSDHTFPWLGITTALGFGFLGGQWLAWRELAARGFFVATSPSSSFFYLLTATHATHLLGGLLVLIWAVVMAVRHLELERRYIVVDVASWYWHFMALLWIYIFALLLIAK